MPIKIPFPKQDSIPKRAPERQRRYHFQAFAEVLTKTHKKSALPASSGVTYTVRAGDTLYRIARQLKGAYDLPNPLGQIVKDMVELNRISNPDLIIPGQQIRLPAFGGNIPVDTNSGISFGDLEVPLPEADIPTGDPTATPRAAPIAEDVTGTETFLSSLSDWSRISKGTPPSPIKTLSNTRKVTPGDPNTEDLLHGIESQNPPGINPAALPQDQSGEQTSTVKPNKEKPEAVLPSSSMIKGKLTTQMAIYEEDQLLAHPGGDYFFPNKGTGAYDPSFDRTLFKNRVGKDLSDAGENLINIAKDLAMGSKFKYVGNDGKIEEGQRVGVFRTFRNFFEDMLSGLSFGAYMPAAEEKPKGTFASIWHFFKKTLYDAPIKDLLVGVPHAGINIGKDMAIAALNLVQVVPDSTIGNFKLGKKITTTIFDNGQVAVEYLTDVLPGSHAWLRVHASGASGELAFPFLYNLQTAEQGITDSRWATVRNTPFRKTIETLGALLADAVSLTIIHEHIPNASADQRQP
jgi:LysM repeat protein